MENRYGNSETTNNYLVDDNKDSRISLDEWMKHAPENPMIQRLLLLSNQEFQEKQKKEQNLKSSGSLNL